MEVEVKLTYQGADGPGFFGKLAEVPVIGGCEFGAPQHLELVDTYYSSPALEAAKGALRLRFQNGEPFITLKLAERQAGGLFVREEIEEPFSEASFQKIMALLVERRLLPAATYDPGAFLAAGATGVLVPVLQTRSVRQERRGAGLSLTLDQVTYPGVSAVTFYDVEIELVGGQEAELRRVQAALVALGRGQLRPARLSKLARGIDLKSIPK